MEPYLVIDLTIHPLEAGRDIVLAFLSETAFDSFEETETGLRAYILEKDWDESIIHDLEVVQNESIKLSFTIEKLSTINWNEEWERHYEPIEIDKDVYIRAPFHPEVEGFTHNLLIEPKMSFGTGHHQTTRLMSRLLLQMNVKGQHVLDMGTGTGILAILAEKLGATKVEAIDNFEWAVENTKENAERNDCKTITALHGDAEALNNKSFDTILANINRNVLLEDMTVYAKCLNADGILAMSGFFKEDAHLIKEEANRQGLTPTQEISEGKWAAMVFRKN